MLRAVSRPFGVTWKRPTQAVKFSGSRKILGRSSAPAGDGLSRLTGGPKSWYFQRHVFGGHGHMALNYASNVVGLATGVELRDGTADPTSGGGVAAPIGSLYLRTSTPQLWQKIGAANTAWALISGTAGSGNGIFGPGLDGDVTIGVGTTVLTADMVYNNLTIPNGATLRNGGYRIFVRNTLTIALGGTLSGNGNPASGISPGLGSIDLNGTINANSGSGGSSASPAGQSQNQYLFGAPVNAGNGGAGGAGSTAAGAAGGTASQVASSNGGQFTAPFLALLLRVDGPTQGLRFTGGAGGGRGGAGDAAGEGGAGGGGGGLLMACARTIINNGTISAHGGAGGTTVNANSGGGGGGGGGIAICMARSYTGAAPTALGGAGGAGNGTGAAGTAGQPGMAVTLLV